MEDAMGFDLHKRTTDVIRGMLKSADRTDEETSPPGIMDAMGRIPDALREGARSRREEVRQEEEDRARYEEWLGQQPQASFPPGVVPSAVGSPSAPPSLGASPPPSPSPAALMSVPGDDLWSSGEPGAEPVGAQVPGLWSPQGLPDLRGMTPEQGQQVLQALRSGQTDLGQRAAILAMDRDPRANLPGISSPGFAEHTDAAFRQIQERKQLIDAFVAGIEANPELVNDPEYMKFYDQFAAGVTDDQRERLSRAMAGPQAASTAAAALGFGGAVAPPEASPGAPTGAPTGDAQAAAPPSETPAPRTRQRAVASQVVTMPQPDPIQIHTGTGVPGTGKAEGPPRITASPGVQQAPISRGAQLPTDIAGRPVGQVDPVEESRRVRQLLYARPTGGSQKVSSLDPKVLENVVGSMDEQTKLAHRMASASFQLAARDLVDWCSRGDAMEVLAKVAAVEINGNPEEREVVKNIKKAEFLGRLLAVDMAHRLRTLPTA